MEKNKYPIPRIETNQRWTGRGYKKRLYLNISVKFPGLPLWWASSPGWDHYKTAQSVLERCNYNHNDMDLPTSDIILDRFFGLTTLQAFQRQLVRKKRIIYMNKRSMWCIPEADVRKVLFRYRSNQWNESEIIQKEHYWLFEELLAQFDDILQGTEPDYSMYDVGPDRKPPVWVCNLCERTAIREEWNWRSTPGVAGMDYISYCPQCKAKGSDFLGSLGGERTENFRPYSKMQDNYLFTFGNLE